MSTNEGLVRRKSALQVPPLTEKVLLATIVVLFLLLHALAGVILQRAGPLDRVNSGQDIHDMTLRLHD
jgi:hypothetical protein